MRGRPKGLLNVKKKTGIAQGFKKYSLCQEVLPEACFKAGRNVCISDDNSVESLQRLLRKTWAKDYNKNMKDCKKVPGKWARGVIAFRAMNTSKKQTNQSHNLVGKCVSCENAMVVEWQRPH